MLKSVEINNQRINYYLRSSSRARCLRLSLRRGGFLTLTKPVGMSDEIVSDFILEQSNWIMDKLKRSGKSSLINGRQLYLKYREAARRLAEKKVKKFSGLYGFSYLKISIRNQATRWGSCSSRGNLSFNYRIIFLPEKILDYVILHELCHLKEFNHGQNFWRRLAEIMPDYADCRFRLKSCSYF